ncbi:MAG: type III-B CRISPR-associated protein Cas10/Cmr2 [Calditerricola sp.]|nr:type III-B CRISPR-associated protein Cas10/Cmr2 [Calditerricola sp.]
MSDGRRKALFLFTLTPVQGFVVTSRKTQDLYNASLLLSYLCETGMKALRELFEKAGKGVGQPPSVRFLFPDEKVPSKPNRFLAEVEGPVELLRRVGYEVEKRVREEWVTIGTTVLDKLELRLSQVQREQFVAQLQRYFQIFWLCYPYSGATDAFEAEYRKAEQLFAALKNVRPFAQLQTIPLKTGNPPRAGETGRKCSLTGEENVLVYRPAPNWKETGEPAWIRNTEPRPVAAPHLGLRYLAEGEALGAVGLVKRAAGTYLGDKLAGEGYEHCFPSTAWIALYPFKDELDAVLREEGLSEQAIEPQYLFALNERQPFAEELETEVQEATERVFRRLKARRNLGENESLSLVPYYALMVFDGDLMGDWFAGAYKKPNVPLAHYHEKLCRQLGEYAAWVRGNLVPPLGKVVYAGGDDLTAFLALDRVFETAQWLRTEFFSKMIDLMQVADRRLTFSAGLVIAHYKDPLSHVLETAWRMEKAAKNSGRNALGVAVLKRSGEAVEAILSWEAGEQTNLGDAVARVKRHWECGRFSPRWVRAFSRWFAPVLEAAAASGDHALPLDAMAWTELARVARRAAQTTDREYELRDAWVEELVEDLHVLHRLCRGKTGPEAEGVSAERWRTFVDVLNILVFFKGKWGDERD